MIKIDLDRIRSEMNRRDLKQYELRQEIERRNFTTMSKQNISHFLSGRIKSFKTCYHICSVLGLDINEVYKYE